MSAEDFLKNFKPEGTPEANEEAQAELEADLSENEKRERGLKVDHVFKQLIRTEPPDHKKIFTDLVTLQTLVRGWENKLNTLETGTKNKIILGKILSEIKKKSDQFEDVSEDIHWNGSAGQDEELREIQKRLSDLKKRLKDIISSNA